MRRYDIFMRRMLVVMALLSLMCTSSCIKDEALNKECDIESAWIEGTEYEKYFYYPNEMKKENISSAETNIVFTVRSLISLPTQIPLNLKITQGATVTPTIGSLQDFTKGPVTYTVTSEDGQWKRTYNVSFQEASLPATMYSFEHVETREEKNIMGPTNKMHFFYEVVSQEKSETSEETKLYCWATGNQGAALVMSNANPEDMPTYSVSNGYVNKGVCLTTRSTGAMGALMNEPIAAGNLFLGEFHVESVMKNPLKATQFGIPVSKDPMRITGYYKYKPGSKYTKGNKVILDRQDEASIYAVFYRNQTSTGEKYFLYGDDLESDEKLKDNPQVYKIARVSALPPTDEWTKFEMFFEGKDAPDDIVEAYGFNMALVFSSSKYGDQFEGAVGSRLYIDEVEVSYKK